MNRTINIYTDGGFKKNRCAWAFYKVETGEIFSGVQRRKKKGSYEAELWAVLKALEHCSRHTEISKVNVFTDHTGIAKIMSSLVPKWNSPDDVKKPTEFWIPLWELSQEVSVRCEWVSNKNTLIKIVDQRCTDELAEALKKAI